MREFEPTLPKGSIQLPENTTTLVIEDVPSDVAWKFITGGGKDLGTEEQKEQLIRMFEGSTKDNKEQLEEKDEHSLDEHQHEIFTLERCDHCDQITTRITTNFHDLKRTHPHILSYTEQHNFVWENTLVGDTIVEVSQCSDCGLINGYRVNDQVFKTEEEMKTAFPELFEVQEETIGHSHSL